MTTITWTIEWMKTTPTTATPPGYVVECGWRCIGTHGALPEPVYTATIYGSCAFNQEPDENGDFMPYERLTEEQVLSWCWGSGVDKAATEAAVEAAVETQRNPPVIQPPLPWQR